MFHTKRAHYIGIFKTIKSFLIFLISFIHFFFDERLLIRIRNHVRTYLLNMLSPIAHLKIPLFASTISSSIACVCVWISLLPLLPCLPPSLALPLSLYITPSLPISVFTLPPFVSLYISISDSSFLCLSPSLFLSLHSSFSLHHFSCLSPSSIPIPTNILFIHIKLNSLDNWVNHEGSGKGYLNDWRSLRSVSGDGTVVDKLHESLPNLSRTNSAKGNYPSSSQNSTNTGTLSQKRITRNQETHNNSLIE